MPPPPELSDDDCRFLLATALEQGPSGFPAVTASVVLAAALLAASLFCLTLEGGIAMTLGILLGGVSILLFQLLLHECAHETLVPSKTANRIAGICFGVMSFMPFGSFRRGHAAHHACLGTEEDPTASPTGPRPWARFVEILVRLRVIPVLYLGGVYFPYLLYDFVSNGKGKDLPPKRPVNWIGNVTLILLAHTGAGVLFGWPKYWGWYLGAFWVAALLYENLFTQNQHVGLMPTPDSDRRYRLKQQVNFSRSVRMPLAGWLLYFNLHKEHHLFPQLPCGYLPTIHNWLVANRADVISFTSDDVGGFRRPHTRKLFSPTVGDHQDEV